MATSWTLQPVASSCDRHGGSSCGTRESLASEPMQRATPSARDGLGPCTGRAAIPRAACCPPNSSSARGGGLAGEADRLQGGEPRRGRPRTPERPGPQRSEQVPAAQLPQSAFCCASARHQGGMLEDGADAPPHRAQLAGPSAERSRPSKNSAPRAGRRVAFRRRRSVDLPAPEGPSSATRSPRDTRSVTSSRARTAPLGPNRRAQPFGVVDHRSRPACDPPA